MLMNILVLKEKCKKIYNDYDVYLSALGKFLIIFFSMNLLGEKIGYNTLFRAKPIMLIVALMASFLPFSLMTIILSVVIVAHVYILSMEMALVILVMMIVMFILYYRFSGKDSILLVLTSIFFFIKIPYFIPIAVGLCLSPISAVSVACGTIIYYLLSYISKNAALINNMSADSVTDKFKMIIGSLLGNNEMYLTVIAFTLVIIVVYTVKRMSVNYSWAIAILGGGIANLAVFLVGNTVVENAVKTPVVSIVVGTMVSIVLAYVFEFLVFSVDYTRTEHTQFEDDEYYYYVKAVPKITVTTPEVSVKHINTRKTKRRSVVLPGKADADEIKKAYEKVEDENEDIIDDVKAAKDIKKDVESRVPSRRSTVDTSRQGSSARASVTSTSRPGASRASASRPSASRTTSSTSRPTAGSSRSTASRPTTSSSRPGVSRPGSASATRTPARPTTSRPGSAERPTGTSRPSGINRPTGLDKSDSNKDK